MFLNFFTIYFFLNIIISSHYVFGKSKEKTSDQLVHIFRVAFPREMKEFRSNLSSSELEILLKIESQPRKYRNIEELIDTIKKASPEIESKFKKLYFELHQKMNQLSVESLCFIYDVGEKVQKLFDSQTVLSKVQPSNELKREYITKYRNLSEDTKNNLKKVLPMYDHLYKLMLKSK